MLEDRFSQHDKVIVDKYHNPEIDYIMSVRDYVLRPIANEVTGPITITLPPVAEAKGRFYSILCREVAWPNTITVTDKDDSECWEDIIFFNSCESILMYSDGLYWHMLGALKYLFDQLFYRKF